MLLKQLHRLAETCECFVDTCLSMHHLAEFLCSALPSFPLILFFYLRSAGGDDGDGDQEGDADGIGYR